MNPEQIASTILASVLIALFFILAVLLIMLDYKSSKEKKQLEIKKLKLEIENYQLTNDFKKSQTKLMNERALSTKQKREQKCQ